MEVEVESIILSIKKVLSIWEVSALHLLEQNENTFEIWWNWIGILIFLDLCCSPSYLHKHELSASIFVKGESRFSIYN
jgi:hypothetical protein